MPAGRASLRGLSTHFGPISPPHRLCPEARAGEPDPRELERRLLLDPPIRAGAAPYALDDGEGGRSRVPRADGARARGGSAYPTCSRWRGRDATRGTSRRRSGEPDRTRIAVGSPRRSLPLAPAPHGAHHLVHRKGIVRVQLVAILR